VLARITNIARQRDNLTRIAIALENDVVALCLTDPEHVNGPYMQTLFNQLPLLEHEILTLSRVCQAAMPTDEPEIPAGESDEH
jgi:hypothetical protein